MKSKIDNRRTYSTDSKRFNERTKYTVYCSNCGHSIVFYPMEHTDKKLCSWCGRYTYKDKQLEFKDLFLKKKRSIENEDR